MLLSMVIARSRQSQNKLAERPTLKFPSLCGGVGLSIPPAAYRLARLVSPER